MSARIVPVLSILAVLVRPGSAQAPAKPPEFPSRVAVVYVDAFVTHGDAAKQRAELGIDADGIARACRELAQARAVKGAA